MKIVVFLGPTLSITDAKAILPDAIFLPPAGQSDLISALTIHHPQVIALIDGVFSQSLSVWHKEILYALEQGVYVYGASSMGALRAAETDSFGMIGVGKIYQMFRDGELTDDDEVALAHASAEDGYRNLSESMVNIRATLRRAVEMGVVSSDIHDLVIASAKSLYFPERSFPTIFKKAELQGVPADCLALLQDFAREHYVNLKRQDAVDLLNVLRDLPADTAPMKADFDFNHSHLFAALYERDRMVERPTGKVSLNAIASYTALNLPDFLTFNVDAMNRKLALVLADMLEIEASQAEIDAELRRFRIRLHLKTPAQYEEWLLANNLSESECAALMREVALVRRLHRWLRSRMHLQGTVQIILDQLRLQNRYTEMADQAATSENSLQKTFSMFLQTDHSHIPLEALLMEHMAATECHIDVNYHVWLEEAGFDSPQHLWMELLKASLLRGEMEAASESTQTEQP